MTGSARTRHFSHNLLLTGLVPAEDKTRKCISSALLLSLVGANHLLGLTRFRAPMRASHQQSSRRISCATLEEAGMSQCAFSTEHVIYLNCIARGCCTSAASFLVACNWNGCELSTRRWNPLSTASCETAGLLSTTVSDIETWRRAPPAAYMSDTEHVSTLHCATVPCTNCQLHDIPDLLMKLARHANLPSLLTA